MPKLKQQTQLLMKTLVFVYPENPVIIEKPSTYILVYKMFPESRKYITVLYALTSHLSYTFLLIKRQNIDLYV